MSLNMRVGTHLLATAAALAAGCLLDGTPLTGGPLECDSWGEDYLASKHG